MEQRAGLRLDAIDMVLAKGPIRDQYWQVGLNNQLKIEPTELTEFL